MNILHISRTMGQGGAEKIVYQLCENNIHRQYVISTGGIYVNKLKKIGVKHFYMPDIENKRITLMIECFFKIFKVVKKQKIDIIHTHHRTAAFYARLICIICPNIKHVYTAHNIFSNRKALTRFSLKNAKIVAVGEGVKNNLINVYKIPDKRVNVIYNSIKRPQIDHQKHNIVLENLLKEKKYLIGNIGRLTEQKGMDIFIKAIANVSKFSPNIVGVIVGDGEDRKKFENIVISLHIEKNICFLGYQENIFEIIKQLNFVVLSSRWEGFPLTPIETFALGKTIIASDISGNKEIIIDGYNGVLFRSENIEDLSKKILFLMKNAKIKSKLENQAKITYNNKFVYEVFLYEYQKIYEKICNERDVD